MKAMCHSDELNERFNHGNVKRPEIHPTFFNDFTGPEAGAS
jgi:hypothetical protein